MGQNCQRCDPVRRAEIWAGIIWPRRAAQTKLSPPAAMKHIRTNSARCLSSFDMLPHTLDTSSCPEIKQSHGPIALAAHFSLKNHPPACNCRCLMRQRDTGDQTIRNRSASVEKQRTPECVAEAVPESPHQPDGFPCGVGSGSKREATFFGLESSGQLRT